jgi:hypothetical protein
MTLVHGWRQMWRWFSVQALAAIAALPVVWAALPPDLKAAVPDGWLIWIAAAVALAGVVGRVIDQGGARR